ncbi:MAG: gamma-glutamyltransferase [Saprospiraceae bacterium]|nr:gamma-glutamyltransferase [Lewinella sp.]
MKNLFLLFFLLVIIACRKPERQLQYGAVTSASPEATAAGMRILKAGGNAADAAIAVSFALAVSEPAMSGIGGGTQVQILLPDGSKPFALNGSTISPASTPLAFEKDSLKRHLRTTIPSTVKTMQYLYDNYSSHQLSWAELLQPAIEIAENGFEMGDFRKKIYQRYEEKLAKGMPATSEYYPLPSDHRSQQNKIALALKVIAGEGATAFYKGQIASSIAEDMVANGGWITREDLADFPNPEILPSVHFNHNGHDIYTQPEPCGGWVVKAVLEKLADLRTENPNGDHLQLLAQALHFGHDLRQQKATEKTGTDTGETTHFSVMDANGFSLSVTASINAYYGAGVANPDYGFLYNSYMDDFNFEEANNKYAVAPNKMAYSSMSPTIVMKDKKVVLIIGSPGSARIISSIAQLIDTFTSGTTDPKELLQLPRIHAINKKVYFEDEHQKAQFETATTEDWEVVKPPAYLAQNGLNAYFGGVHAIVWTGREYLALADPRRDGLALSE